MKKIILNAVAIAGVVLLSSQVSAQSLPADTSFTGLFNSIKSEVDAPRMELMLNEMIKKASGEQAQMLVDVSAQNTAFAFAEAGNVAKAKYWAGKVQGTEWKASTLSGVVSTLINNGRLNDAEAIVGPIVDPAKGPSEFTLLDGDKAQFRGLYGMIRYKQGKYKEALPFLTTVAGRGDGSRELYAMALSRSGNIDQAFEEMNKIMHKAAHLGDDFQKEARVLFIKKQGNDTRFNAIVDSIALSQSQKIAAKVEKMKVAVPAPDFEIKDFEGKTVSLKSLRGKTVFIDFWATWCVPCVASFPGMQKAVDYYKGDTSVVFMFVHTAEKSTDATQEAKKMIASKKYRFDVYMDLKDKATGRNPMMSAFRVTNLPTKLVIDPEGMIRYRSAGYIGVDEAIPEVKTMIEMARKESIVAQVTPSAILSDTRSFEVSACKPSEKEIITVWMEKRPERKDNDGNAADMRVAYKSSADNGNTWTAKGIVDLPDTFGTGNPFVSNNEKGNTYMVCMHIGKDFYSGNISLYEFDSKKRQFDLKSVPVKSDDKLLDKPSFVSRGDEIHLVYVAYPKGMKNSVKYQMSKNKGRTWTEPVDVFPGNNGGHLGPAITISKNNQIIVSIGAYGRKNVLVARKNNSDGASFEKPIVVSAVSTEQGAAMTELSSYDNGVILTWQNPHQRSETYLSYSKDNGANWVKPTMLTSFGNLLSAAFDEKGNIHCIYSDFSDQKFFVGYKLLNSQFETLKSRYLLAPTPLADFKEYLGAYQKLLIQKGEVFTFWIDYPNDHALKFTKWKP